MADRVVLINGLPASGKTTLGEQLAAELGWVLISKDVLKEAFAELVWPQVSSPRLGGLALDSMYALAGAIEGGVVLDSLWLSTRDRPFLESGLAVMGEPRVVEVWCDVPEALAHERYDRREPSRHEMHESWRPGFWNDARPVTENPVRVDTSIAVDVAALATRVLAAVTA
ncbi:MAG: ATP-binding protein [Pseudolysinimonas sp.]